jgi:hypothetical protein
MKHLIISACFALIMAPLFADDQFIIKAKWIESPTVIPNDIRQISTMEGVNFLTTPLMTTYAGQPAQSELIKEDHLAATATGGFKVFPHGVLIRVTPQIQKGQITFVADFTLRQPVASHKDDDQTSAELISRELHVSGKSKDGEIHWFHFDDASGGKKHAVWLQIDRKTD